MEPSAQSGLKVDAALSQALERLWVRFLPQIKQRVAALEEAVAAVAAGTLTASCREAAYDAAHKLAGVLGTFNLTRGTVLARELELTFSRESAPGAESGEGLAAIAAELRAMVESRPTSG